MREFLYKMGGRKFIAFVGATATALLGWGFGRIEPYDALVAVVAAAIAYMTANVIDSGTDAERAQKGADE